MLKGKIFQLAAVSLVFSCLGMSQTLNEKYDSILAKKYGADNYGMKNYILVLLKTGPTQIEDKAKVSELFAGHLSNIGKLVDERKMIVAGPLAKNELYRGIFILDMTDLDAARNLMDTDPAIKAGLLEPILLKWYGSAALPSYLENAFKVGKYRF